MAEEFEVRGLVLTEPIRQPHSFCVPGAEKGEPPLVITSDDVASFIKTMAREWARYEDKGAPADEPTPTEAILGLLICEGMSQAQAQGFMDGAHYLYRRFLESAL